MAILQSLYEGSIVTLIFIYLYLFCSILNTTQQIFNPSSTLVSGL